MYQSQKIYGLFRKLYHLPIISSVLSRLSPSNSRVMFLYFNNTLPVSGFGILLSSSMVLSLISINLGTFIGYVFELTVSCPSIDTLASYKILIAFFEHIQGHIKCNKIIIIGSNFVIFCLLLALFLLLKHIFKNII